MPLRPVIRHMKGLPQDQFAADGLMYQDWDAVTPCQRSITTRFGLELQRQQEDYFIRHPELIRQLEEQGASTSKVSPFRTRARVSESAFRYEELCLFCGKELNDDHKTRKSLDSRREIFKILAMLKIFIAKMTRRKNRKDTMTDAALHFTRPFEELDAEIRTFLESPAKGPYVNLDDRKLYEFDDLDFQVDLNQIILEHHPLEPWVYEPPPSSIPNTLSSSFISVQTSENTLPTPEPIPTPELTISEIFYNMISMTVDKVIYVQVDEAAILYDTAYVELMKAVENAMEIPVVDIRVDIANLFREAFGMFEVNIMAKEAYAAEIAWHRRMRKKLKKTLRRQNNFKGYETPPTPKSEISSHESYKRPPPRPCECQPLAHYNRYGKDRFGIYLPRAKEDDFKKNVTTTPDCISLASKTENDDKVEARSIRS